MPKHDGPIHIVVAGFPDCPYYQRASNIVQQYSAKIDKLTCEMDSRPRTEFHARREAILRDLGKSPDSHRTCPLVYTTYHNKPTDYIGGCDDTIKFLVTEYGNM